jgi:hypothetical protein
LIGIAWRWTLATGTNLSLRQLRGAHPDFTASEVKQNALACPSDQGQVAMGAEERAAEIEVEDIIIPDEPQQRYSLANLAPWTCQLLEVQDSIFRISERVVFLHEYIALMA